MLTASGGEKSSFCKKTDIKQSRNNRATLDNLILIVDLLFSITNRI